MKKEDQVTAENLRTMVRLVRAQGWRVTTFFVCVSPGFDELDGIPLLVTDCGDHPFIVDSEPYQ